MLRYFFEKSEEDNGALFHSLKIWQEPKYRGFQGQFPVVFLSLKDIKHSMWQDTQQSFRSVIAKEFERHSYLLEGDFLTTKERDLFHRIRFEEPNQTLYDASLLNLTEWLHRYHKKRVFY